MNNAETQRNFEQVESPSGASDASKKSAEQLAKFLLQRNQVAKTPDGITAPPQGITAPPQGIEGDRQKKNVTEVASILGKFAPEAVQQHTNTLQSMLDQIA